ncbi:MAG TPA: 2-hydroxyhepta-2,4-diene-1,7-dioate isomerase [Flavobacteriales bacterium]|nr:2-hydroxyhepta-2,4-diene-1,7-dioate isomerase [Flavobacteriales bacterium]|tara:strand:- start:35 stop:655 length:621 start_codon:yes stop_codon:yes gene_type:complete
MKLICIGRNYADHVSELGNVTLNEPLFFLKPDSAVLPHRHPFYIPPWTGEVHHEIELLVRITRNGKNIAPEFAHRYFDELSLGIDFTARDVQSALKAKGHPWEKAKGFDGSAVLSKKWIPKATWKGGWELACFTLKKNGRVVQSATAESMIFHVHDLIAYVSQYMTLKMGDVIFTGTPAGVGPVADGDVLEGFLDEYSMFRVQIHG